MLVTEVNFFVAKRLATFEVKLFNVFLFIRPGTQQLVFFGKYCFVSFYLLCNIVYCSLLNLAFHFPSAQSAVQVLLDNIGFVL